MTLYGQYPVDQGCSIVDPNFVIYVLKMLFDGDFADEQSAGNLRILQPQKKEGSHIDLPSAQMKRVHKILRINVWRR